MDPIATAGWVCLAVVGSIVFVRFARHQLRLIRYVPDGSLVFQAGKGRVALSTMSGYHPANVFVTPKGVVTVDVYTWLANYRYGPPAIRTFELDHIRHPVILNNERKTPISVPFNVRFDYDSSSGAAITVRLWVRDPSRFVSCVTTTSR